MRSIVNAILDCALPHQQLVEKTKRQGPTSSQKTKQYSDGVNSHEAEWPQGNTKPWAKLTSPNREKRLMVRLGLDSPHRSEHPFILRKKSNAAIPNKVIGKMAHINSRLTLIPAPVTTWNSWERIKRH